MKRYGLLSLKIILWVLGIFVLLVGLVFILIQVPSVQNLARKKVVSYLETKLKTPVEINKLSFDFPKVLVLEDIYFEDQQGDTLLAGDTLKVDISLFKLMSNTVQINEIDLRGISGKVSRGVDSVSNYDYVIDAFMSDQKKEPTVTDTTSAMKFSLDKIRLDRISLSYDDKIAAARGKVFIGHFDTQVKEFDMNKMAFNIPAVRLHGVRIDYEQFKLPAEPEPAAIDSIEAAQPLNMDLKLGDLDLKNINISYKNAISAISTQLKIPELFTRVNLLDLKNQEVRLEDIQLKGADIDFTFGRKESAKVVAKEIEQELEGVTDNWRVSVTNIDLVDNDIRYDDMNMARVEKGIDFSHMDVKKLSLQASDLSYAIDSISGAVSKASFSEQRSGLILHDLRTNFLYSSTKASFEDLYIRTDRSEIRDYIRLRYRSIDAIAKRPGDLGMEANLKNSKIAFRDMLAFVPELAEIDMFRNTPDAVLFINGSVKGRVGDMEIPALELRGYRNTTLIASGKIRGLPDAENMVLDLKIRELNTRAADLLSILPKGTVPPEIRLPERIRVRGIFKGSPTTFTTDLDLNSSDGSAKAIAYFDSRSAGRERYKANIRLFDFNVGRLLRQEANMGRVTLAANATGVGLDPKTMNTTYTGRVIRADYNGYSYRNLSIDGTFSRGMMNARADMNDPNLNFDGTLSAGFTGKYPSVKAAILIDSADFRKLNFLKQDLRFHGLINADLTTADPDFLNGRIDVTNSIVAFENERYTLDSVSLIGTADADSNTLQLRSEMLTADLSGKYKLTELMYAAQDIVNQYFQFGDPVKPGSYSPQNITFNARLINSPLLRQLVPDLQELSPVNISGGFNSSDRSLSLNADAPRILYGSNDIRDLSLRAATEANGLAYELDLGAVVSSSFEVRNTTLSGAAADNVLGVNLQVENSAREVHYFVGGDLRSEGSNFVFSLRPEGLVLNYEPWTVGAGNMIRFGNSGFEASNFQLINQNQRISLNTTPPGLNNPVKIDFSNFKLETITAFASKDSLLAGGEINGTVLASELTGSPVFTADMAVRDFNFRGDTLGQIDIDVNNKQAGLFAADIRLTGSGNDLVLDGTYNTNTSTMDMDLNVVNLNLKSIEGFSFGSIDSAKGSISGKLNITGTAADPRIKGDLGFQGAGFNIPMLNSYFLVQDNVVRFNGNEVVFDGFVLIDSAQNTASVDGTIIAKSLTDYAFDLDLNTENFRAINSTAEDNELFYGQLYMDADLSIGGTLSAPVVDGVMKVNADTRFTVVLPQTDPAIEERQGIVEFVDMDNPELDSILMVQIDSLSNTSITGMNVAVNLEVDKEAEFSIIIDEANGDFLRLRGEAELSAAIDPSGKISLTGSYNLEEGAYELSFNFLKRRFEIEKGSSIVWNGEPMDADVDVTATYIAETAPLELVDLALGDASQLERNIYKQRLPFEVNLNMEGQLLKPTINFDIILPEKNYNVSTEVTGLVNTRLEQLRQEPSELNKQVFALLLLNRFVGENPFAGSSGGGNVESLARQSVSKILSEQLNSLAGDLIAGVDINFDLNTYDDYTTGQRANRTDLNVGLSKRLLNDRLKVNVGSNFELEGPQQPGARTSNFAGDISVEYMLSKDGRYMLRAYQKNEYEVAIQGQVIETGVGFVLSMDYNKFREIFHTRSDDTKERRKAERRLNKAARRNDTE